MKNLFILLCLLGALYSCKNQSSNFPPIQTNEESGESVKLHVPFDTILYDHDTVNQLRDARNDLFEKLSMPIIIDSLKSFCLLPRINEISSDNLPFQDPMEIGKYYENNIPRSIYKMIFPGEEIKIDRIIKTNSEIDYEKKTVTINKGPKEREERIYKSLLSLHEKENYLKLLITKQGKYVPEIELVTVSKHNLQKIDRLNLMGGIYDSSDIDYWHSTISDDFENIELTKVKNLKFDEVELDTTILQYSISPSGAIIQK